MINKIQNSIFVIFFVIKNSEKSSNSFW